MIPLNIYSSLANDLCNQSNRSLTSDLHSLIISGGENASSLFNDLTLD